MLLDGTIYIAFYCGACSKFESFEISLFDLKKDEEFTIESICSDNYITIKTRNFKNFYLSIPCVSCGMRHKYKYSLLDIIKNKPGLFKCRFSKLDILYVGDKEYIENVVKKSAKDLESIIGKLGPEEHIVNPYIMAKTLEKISDIVDKDNLFCDCGGKQIDITMFSDRIELICVKCGSVNIIYAENYEDLKAIINKNLIVLRERSFTCLDSIYYSGRI